jgi:hypothetical protein
MSLGTFVSIEKFKKDDITICFLTINNDIPTSFQWKCAMGDIKDNLDELKLDNNNFAFVMDVRKVGILPMSQIQEFVNLLESYGPLLEERLISSSVYTSSGSIIDVLFAIVKRFYKTKKPLKFVYNLDEAYEFINENKNFIIKDP